jgi:hypothetical protein
LEKGSGGGGVSLYHQLTEIVAIPYTCLKEEKYVVATGSHIQFHGSMREIQASKQNALYGGRRTALN